jgi:hypothetical protein
MHSGTTIFCLHCGHENPAHNHFCGMCGAELVRARSAESLGDAYGEGEPSAQAEPPIYQPAAEYPQPSFGHRYADDEAPSHWKLYLFAAMIAVAGFVIAYQWGKPNFDTSKILAVLQRPEKKSVPAGEEAAPAAAQTPPSQAGAVKPDAATGAGAPQANPGGGTANSQPAAGTDLSAPSQRATPGRAPDQNSAATLPIPEEKSREDAAKTAGNSGQARAGDAAERGLSEQDIPTGQVPPAPANQQPAPRSTKTNAAPAENTDAEENDDEEARVSPPPAVEPRSPSRPTRSAPAGARESAEPLPDRQQQAASDLLVDTAQNYLYGRGVPRDCDRALSYLRRAADTSARAKTQLGAMYATGQCVPQDRPTAYHWMALAFRSDPRNSYLEHDLQMLWSQMTADEKQRALRMTR